MAEDQQADPLEDDLAREPVDDEGDVEEVDAQLLSSEEPLPWMPPAREVSQINPGAQVVQTAAVATAGFLAGAAVIGLARRRRRAVLARARPRRRLGSRKSSERSRGASELLQIVASRSLLVDVHLLGGSGEDR